MVRKRVWLGVFLLVVVIAPFISAYDLGFTYSTKYDGNTDVDDFCTGKNFKSEFLAKYSSGSFILPTGVPYSVSESGPGFAIHNDDWDAYSEPDYFAHFMYAYAYILDEVYSTTLKAGVDSNEMGQHFCTDVGVMWYALPDDKALSLNKGSALEYYLLTTTPIEMLPQTDPCAKRSTGYQIKETVFDAPNSKLPPGVYFLMMGVGGHADSKFVNAEIDYAMTFAKFNLDDTYATSLDQRYSTTRTRFIITQAALSRTELNTLFGTSVENTTWLCQAAGGQIFTDVRKDFKYNDATKKVEVGGVDTGFVYNHLCCGDDDNGAEFYAFNYSGKTHLCRNGKWEEPVALNDKCVDLVSGNGYDKGDVYNQAVNVNNWGTWQIGLQYAPYQTGVDGCCGDDDLIVKTCSGTVSCSGLSGTDSRCNSGNGCSVVSCSSYSGCAGENCVDTANTCATHRCTPDENAWCDISTPFDATTCSDRGGTWSYEYSYCSGYVSPSDRYSCMSYGGTWRVSYVYCTGTSGACVGSGTDCKYLGVAGCDVPGCTLNTLPGKGDYSYIDATKKYFCYANFKSNSPLFNWTNAVIDKYYIRTINDTLGKERDAISNSAQWFVCNATGNTPLNGVPVGDGKTFNNINPSGKFSCADMVSTIVGKIFEDKCDENRPPHPTSCCMYQPNPDNGGVLGPEFQSDVRNCKTCYISQSTGPVNPDDYVLPNLPTGTNPLINSDLVDKDSCVLDPEACLGGTSRYEPGRTCEEQKTGFSNVLCNETTHKCVNGISLPTAGSSDKNLCCFGAEAKCVLTSDIKDDQSCADKGGKPFVPDRAYVCSNILQYGTSTDAKYCCMGTLSFNYEFMKKLSVANTSFLCFKEDNNDMFSQCCFDSNCRNTAYSGRVQDVNLYDRRISTRGSSIHTLENYDQINTTANDLIRDKAGRYFINSGGEALVYLASSTRTLNLTSFSYLEFDILTDSSSISLKINDADLGNLSNYTVGYSNTSRVWRHVVIPLNQGVLSDVYYILYLRFYDSFNIMEHHIILDNIQLTADQPKWDKSTKNYYCTGGFSSWISDLDAPPGATTFEQKGPYMFACSGIASYGWTGTQCCGDDTKLNNYGEFFNDTESGCFNGTKIINNKRVSDIFGIYESANYVKDDLKNFKHADLLYINNSFIGCQVPLGKYQYLKNNTNGFDATGPLILSNTNNIANQCTVKGDYYCMNGVWRRLVLTNTNNNPGQSFPSTANITLKFAPSGPDLIKQGFRK